MYSRQKEFGQNYVLQYLNLGWDNQTQLLLSFFMTRAIKGGLLLRGVGSLLSFSLYDKGHKGGFITEGGGVIIEFQSLWQGP